jgi:hypothetical protein
MEVKSQKCVVTSYLETQTIRFDYYLFLKGVGVNLWLGGILLEKSTEIIHANGFEQMINTPNHCYPQIEK